MSHSNLRKRLALFVVLSCMTGCIRKSDLTAVDNPIAATLTKADAYNCSQVCDSIQSEIVVKNRSMDLYCISDDYQRRFEANYIVIVDRATGRRIKSKRSTGLLPEDARGGGDTHYAKWLLSGSNHVIQPGGTISMVAVMDGFFSVPKSPMTANLKLYYYPCSSTLLAQRGARTIYLSTPITGNVGPA